MSGKSKMSSPVKLSPRITVIGVGGAGGNAVNNMIASGLLGVNFVVANTDAQALAMSSAERTIQLGANLTEGLGAGSKPEIGEAAAEEAVDEIRACAAGSHVVFVAAGMGGGTGTGAAAVIARVAKSLGILVVGVVTKPFHFEGNRRMRMAEAGIAELQKHVDTLIVIPNQNLFRIANEKTTFAEAFVLADKVLHAGVACVTDLVIREGLINLDFADVRTVMTGMGSAMMGTGEASGERRAIIAAEQAIQNPLLDDISLRGARGLLISIAASHDLTLYEVDEAAGRIRQEVDPEANIIVGATLDESLGDKVRVSIVASGLMATVPNGQERNEHGRDQGQDRSLGWVPGAAQAAPPYAHQQAAADRSETKSPYWNDAIDADAYPPIAREPIPQLRPSLPHQQQADVYIEPARGREPAAPQGGSWQGSGDVVIELGPPQISGNGGRPREQRPNQDAAAESRAPFQAQPSNESRRPPRRAPEVQDFSEHAQREFAAKRGGNSVAQPQAVPEKRRGGLFSRLTTSLGGESQSAPFNSDWQDDGHQAAADQRRGPSRANEPSLGGSNSYPLPRERDPSVWEDNADPRDGGYHVENQGSQRNRSKG